MHLQLTWQHHSELPSQYASNQLMIGGKNGYWAVFGRSVALVLRQLGLGKVKWSVVKYQEVAIFVNTFHIESQKLEQNSYGIPSVPDALFIIKSMQRLSTESKTVRASGGLKFTSAHEAHVSVRERSLCFVNIFYHREMGSLV